LNASYRVETECSPIESEMVAVTLPGKLSIVNKETLRELFTTIQPIFNAAKGLKVILMTPLSRYLWNRC
jgi:hypothetical protein